MAKTVQRNNAATHGLISLFSILHHDDRHASEFELADFAALVNGLDEAEEALDQEPVADA